MPVQMNVDDKIVTNGGRVLGVTAVLNKNNLRDAREKGLRSNKANSF
jgi:phosphoribosylamine-glycine ligase